MRILMFCPQFAPVIGGAERQAEKLGRALAARGMDVVVWTPRLDRVSPAVEVRDGLRVHRFPLSDLSRGLRRRWGVGLINAPWIAVQIICRIWRAVGDADIVHCHIGSLQSIAAAGAARMRGVPVICKAATAHERSDLGEIARAGVMGRLAAWAGRYAFNHWVATTDAVRDSLVRAGVAAARVVLMPNGVEVLGLDERATNRHVRRFLYLGRLSTNTQRDVPGLLQAFDLVASEYPDAELAVVGGGDLLSDTRQRASVCRHASRIRVTGPGDAGEWLQWADCFVLPSRREGMSNALLEAMAAGLPCIAYDIGPNREVLDDGQAGCLVPLDDVQSLAAAMLRMARDESVARQHARAGVKRVAAHYSIEAVTSSCLALYESLARDSRRRPRPSRDDS